MAHLFVELLKDSLNEYAYAAEIAGVSYKLENTMYGIYVSDWLSILREAESCQICCLKNLRPVYTGDFCRGNSMQFLSR